MASKLRPVGHDDRLSLVEHLDELRSRLIICAAGFVVALVLCMWQSDTVLSLINKPLEQSAVQKDSNDPLEQAAIFQQRLAEAARAESAWLRELARDAEAHQEGGEADDQPRPELVEVLDEAQAVVMRDRPQRGAAHSLCGAGAPLGTPLGDDVALQRRLLALGPPQRGLGAAALRRTVVVLVVVIVFAAALAADRVLELAHPAPQLAPQAGEALGPEDQEHDHQDDDQLGRSDGVEHRETPLVGGR